MSSKLTQAEEKWRNHEENSTLIAELIKKKKEILKSARGKQWVSMKE